MIGKRLRSEYDLRKLIIMAAENLYFDSSIS